VTVTVAFYIYLLSKCFFFENIFGQKSKTETKSGISENLDNEGIIPRAINKVFEILEQETPNIFY
jgi:hypothetical protein